MAQDLTTFKGTACLNCGTNLIGNYCVECGQRATDVNLSVQTLMVEFVESLFSLEFGFWQTFKRLIFFPGSLTLEYISGRRKRYSSPVRLYLLTSLLFFFLVGLIGSDGVEINTDDKENGKEVLTGQEAVEVFQERFSENETQHTAAEIDSTLQSTLGDLPGKEGLSEVINDPGAAKRRFFRYLPRAMFLMVPLAALFFKMVYFRHKIPYLHFLVFALHLHALFYLTASLAGLAGEIKPESVGESIALVIFLSFPINLARAQRRVFGDGWFKAIVKSGLVWHVYGFFLLLIIIGVSLMTVFLS